jgi:hypothetical protein
VSVFVQPVLRNRYHLAPGYEPRSRSRISDRRAGSRDAFGARTEQSPGGRRRPSSGQLALLAGFHAHGRRVGRTRPDARSRATTRKKKRRHAVITGYYGVVHDSSARRAHDGHGSCRRTLRGGASWGSRPFCHERQGASATVRVERRVNLRHLDGLSADQLTQPVH